MSSDHIFIAVLKNDVEEFKYDDDSNSDNYYTGELLSFSWTMVLRENDQVHLKMVNGKGLLVALGIHPVWFNGHLLKQQV